MDMPDRITKSNSAKAQFRQELEDRTTRLAVGTFKLLDGLPKKNSTRVIAFQLGKSASSVRANDTQTSKHPKHPNISSL